MVLVEAFGDVQDELTKTVGRYLGSFGPVLSCCKKHPEGQQSLYGTRFNTGD